MLLFRGPARECATVRSWLDVPILAQPDDLTCGPTCLQAVYAYYGLHLPLAQVIEETPRFEEGGTLGVLLGLDALRRGFRAELLTYNLKIFDPTWFEEGGPDLGERLRLRQSAIRSQNRKREIAAHLEFLERGGVIRFEDLTPSVLRRYLKKDAPILTGLSATYLYRSAREVYDNGSLHFDDVQGEPQGHFVVLCGYDPETRTVGVADPLHSNPIREQSNYGVDIHRLVCATLLGVVTYDANLLVIRPARSPRGDKLAHPPDR
jgi:hypothetical protein